MGKNDKDKILTPEGRLVFPNLFKPTSFEAQGKETYNAVLIFPKGTDLSRIIEGVRKSAQDAGLKGSGIRNPIRDGNEKADDWGEVFRDASYIRVSTIFKPQVVDRQKQEIIEESRVYSGCYARAVIRCHAYDKLGNKGVSLGLDAIQITRDGEPLGGGAASVAMFDELPSADTDLDNDPFA